MVDDDLLDGLVLLLILKIFVGAWLAMLLLGMFAGYMAMPGLAIGYWATLGVVAMVKLVFLDLSDLN